LDVPQRMEDRRVLASGPATFPIVFLGEMQVGDNQLGDAEVVRSVTFVSQLASMLASSPQPFTDKAIIFVPADSGAVWPQVEVSASECHDGLTTGAVFAIRRNRAGKTWHSETLPR
ncbi:MAG: hypothetical protein WD468_03015, partial [Pirellulales bacterium]